MFTSHSIFVETVHQINSDVKIYGSDRFFIFGLKKILNGGILDAFNCGLHTLIIKVWTDITVTDSIYPGPLPYNSDFVVICPEQTMRVVKGLPGYENALFLNASASVGELTWELVSWLEKKSKQGNTPAGFVSRRGIYIPGRKEKELIISLLRWGDIRTIARMLNCSDKTLYSRLRKVYSEMGVDNRQELFLKIQILFEYGLWNKDDFATATGFGPVHRSYNPELNLNNYSDQGH